MPPHFLTGSTITDGVVLASGLAVAWKIWSSSRSIKSLPLPPGPRGLPILGNLLDIPTKQEWFTYTDWGKKYGPISYVEVLGHHIVILNTYEIACELLDRRSSIYSDKPIMYMVHERMGFGWLTSLLRYGDRLKRHRVIIHKYLQPLEVKNYAHIQAVFVHRLLGHLLEAPVEFLQHIRSSTGCAILMVTYGYEAAPENDKFISLVSSAVKWVSKAAVPGMYLVDFMPFLKYIPDWFPCTRWKNDGRAAYKESQAMLRLPFEDAKERIGNGIAIPSLLSQSLEDDMNKEDEDIIAEALGTLYAAGSDTTVSALQSAILAIVLNPDILKRAQAELDRVIKNNRLPSFEDRESLPYIEGILRESLRWNPVTPLGGPHRVSEEDMYEGYKIPRDSIVIANQWGMLHDEQRYPDPFAFKPERWLDSEGNILEEENAPLHSGEIAFGFGRRVCLGRFFAENAIFISIASILSVFDIRKPIDAEGRPITPTVNYCSGLLSHPDPFECLITPRSAQAASLIKQAVESAKF